MPVLEKPWGQTKPPVGFGVDWGDPVNARLAAFYLFNEGAGRKAFDLTGRYNTNTFVGGGADDVKPTPAKFGMGVSGSPTPAHCITLPVNPLDNAAAFTCMGWAKCNSSAFGICSDWNAVNQILIRDNGSNGFQFFTHTGADVGGAVGGTFTNGVWFHWAATYDGANQRWYFNGVLQTTTAQTGSLASTSGIQVFTLLGSNGASDHILDGIVDHIRIWLRALRGGEILRLMYEPFAGILTPRRRIISGVAAGGFTAVNRRSLGSRVGSRSYY